MTEFQRLSGEPSRREQPPETSETERLKRLTEVATLYQDDLLAGLTLSDSELWDDWQLVQTETLRHQLTDVLKHLVILCTRRGAWDAAIEHARRWLAVDPLNEAAQRHLVTTDSQTVNVDSTAPVATMNAADKQRVLTAQGTVSDSGSSVQSVNVMIVDPNGDPFSPPRSVPVTNGTWQVS